MHVSGEQLGQYTGIAATLRFPLVMPNTEEQKGDSDDDDDDYRKIPTQQPLGPPINAKKLSNTLEMKPSSIPEESRSEDIDERDQNDLCDDFIGEERRRRLSSADLSSRNFDIDMMGLG
jgi:hypothetical protein